MSRERISSVQECSRTEHIPRVALSDVRSSGEREIDLAANLYSPQMSNRYRRPPAVAILNIRCLGARDLFCREQCNPQR